MCIPKHHSLVFPIENNWYTFNSLWTYRSFSIPFIFLKSTCRSSLVIWLADFPTEWILLFCTCKNFKLFFFSLVFLANWQPDPKTESDSVSITLARLWVVVCSFLTKHMSGSLFMVIVLYVRCSYLYSLGVVKCWYSSITFLLINWNTFYKKICIYYFVI